MKTKNIGIILAVIGLVMMIYTGFNYVTTKKVADFGSVEITKEEDHPVKWSPIVGVVLLAAGVVVVLMNKDK